MKVFEDSLVYQGSIQLVYILFSSFLGFIPLSCSAKYMIVFWKCLFANLTNWHQSPDDKYNCLSDVYGFRYVTQEHVFTWRNRKLSRTLEACRYTGFIYIPDTQWAHTWFRSTVTSEWQCCGIVFTLRNKKQNEHETKKFLTCNLGNHLQYLLLGFSWMLRFLTWSFWKAYENTRESGWFL